MEEKYTFEDKNSGEDAMNEPAIEYGYQTELKMKGSPPLTEEELANAITGEELLGRVIPRIKKFFE